MKYLPLLLLTLFTTPAQAITWNQFWRPFRYDNHYVYPRVYSSPCYRTVERVEYVPPTYWNPGYYRRWNEVVRVSCY